MYHAKKNIHIHLIGIGGIGMSGLAKILLQQGYIISGCDYDIHQKSINDLQSLGCTIASKNNDILCNSKLIDYIIYSSAIKSDNNEIMQAKKNGIPTIHRSLMLAELMRSKYSIAISGSHGKTTTSAMIAHILLEAKLDPTIIIGGYLHSISTNAQLGNGNFLVAETDESDRSFLHLHPTLAVVTNIDLEHLETYKDIEDIKTTFLKFLTNLPFYGKAFICLDDPIVSSLLPLLSTKITTYGQNKNADWKANNIVLHKNFTTYTICYKNTSYGIIKIPMPGLHNALNSLAACAIAADIGIPMPSIINHMQTFQGVDRRFTYRGLFQGAMVFDDYGHHPTEIKNTILIAKQQSYKKLIMIFQPHRYTRTEKLWDEFITMFLESKIDHLIITDIFPASEAPIPNITSKKLTEALLKNNPTFPIDYIPFDNQLISLKQAVTSIAQKNDLLLFQGAGKINKIITHLTL